MFVHALKQVIFYEKTGCSGNARQKALLKEHGSGFDIPKLNALLHINMPIPQTINACLSSDLCNNV